MFTQLREIDASVISDTSVESLGIGTDARIDHLSL